MKSKQIGYLLPNFDHKTSAFLIDLENKIPCYKFDKYTLLNSREKTHISHHEIIFFCYVRFSQNKNHD